MARYYIQYVPIRRGLTGREMLAQHLDECFSDVKFTGVISNGLVEFGYLEGDSAQLSDVLNLHGSGFSIDRMFVNEFRGAMKLYWNPPTAEMLPEGETIPTLDDIFIQHSIEATDDIVSDVKAYKIKQLKEFTKKKFNDYNDLVANLTKEILLLAEYRSELDTAQTTRLNDALTSIKSLYSIETCLAALEEDVAVAAGIMPDYYTKKNSIQNCITVEDIELISLVS